MTDSHRPWFTEKLRPDLELVDETLREGAERATVAPTLDEKVELGIALARTGLRSLVVGMFPDVPHNVALLERLVTAQSNGQIPADVRFIVISHLGATLRQTRAVLHDLGAPLHSVWILGIHSVSDLQIRYLFPKVIAKDPAVRWDDEEWAAQSDHQRAQQSLLLLGDLLDDLTSYEGGGVLVGLLDAFRARHEHLSAAVDLVAARGVRQIRLVDAAGTCTPQQVPPWLTPLIASHPEVGFFCHFHDDFGLATANALAAVTCGVRGVDVSVGGFANRAGHPALAEVALALRMLYGHELPGFRYGDLTALSRSVEQTYGLIERATQPITGPITHAVQAGIRTELVGEARWMFDVIDPESVGAHLQTSFGGRSGYDDLRRIIDHHRRDLDVADCALSAEDIRRLYPAVVARWQAHSDTVRPQLQAVIRRYHALLDSSYFTEEQVVEFAMELASSHQTKLGAPQ